jgi:hypothetical protein
MKTKSFSFWTQVILATTQAPFALDGHALNAFVCGLSLAFAFDAGMDWLELRRARDSF